MGKTAIALLLAAAVLAGCGSSTKSRSSLISATAPTTVLAPGSVVGTTTSPTPTGTAGTETPTSGTSTTILVPKAGPLTTTQFKAEANAICGQVDAEARSVGTAGATANASAASKLTRLEAYSKQGVAQLTAIQSRGPAAVAKADGTFLVFVNEEDQIGARAASDAGSGSQADYDAQFKKLAALARGEAQAGNALAPACAQG